MHDLIMAFVPMFFAMDPVGLLPVFVSLTSGLEDGPKKRIVVQSLVTATLVAVGFIYLGKWILKFLGITMGDFMVAGGAVLCCLSLLDLCGRTKGPAIASEDVGAVPIGTPLIAGPAVLTMSMVLMAQYGMAVTVAAVALNILIVAVIFIFANLLIRMIGKSGANALSKVLSLLLAAIGVMMVRRGILEMIAVHQ